MTDILNPLPYFVLIPFFAYSAFLIGKWTGWDRCDSVQRAGKNYYAGINGLRGFLAISVFFCHAVMSYYFIRRGRWGDTPPSNFYAQMGTFAVTMFFFITGFLFWSKLMDSPQGLNPGRFLKHRFRRLFPAYVASFVLILAVLSVQYGLRAADLNLHLASEIGRWLLCGIPFDFTPINDLPNSTIINGAVFWTLRIEWAFYFLLPFLFWFTKARRLLILLIAAFAISLATPLLQDHAPDAVKDLVELLTQLAFYIFSVFCIGMVAAYARRNWALDRPLQHRACAPVAAALWLITVFLIPSRFGLLESTLLGIIFFMVVFGNDFYGLLSSKPLQFLGTMSYSLYLLHAIVLYVCTHLINRLLPFENISAIQYWLLVAGIGILALALSALSYRFIEYPWIRSHSNG